MKKAFTLMEILIVLIIIGILTAILIPAFKEFRENAELIKFLRAHQAFTTAISSITNSDYYLDGDLGIKPNGDLIDGTHTGDTTYLCETMAQFLDTKKVNCVSSVNNAAAGDGYWDTYWNSEGKTFEQWVDRFCSEASASDVKNIKPGEGIILKDGTVFFESVVVNTFGQQCNSSHSCPDGNRLIKDRDRAAGEMVHMYKVLCIEINAVNNGHNQETCVGTCPFGYGVRYDGKIIPGRQATEWLDKAKKENVTIFDE